jgi:hypothetical protein
MTTSSTICEQCRSEVFVQPGQTTCTFCSAPLPAAALRQAARAAKVARPAEALRLAPLASCPACHTSFSLRPGQTTCRFCGAALPADLLAAAAAAASPPVAVPVAPPKPTGPPALCRYCKTVLDPNDSLCPRCGDYNWTYPPANRVDESIKWRSLLVALRCALICLFALVGNAGQTAAGSGFATAAGANAANPLSCLILPWAVLTGVTAVGLALTERWSYWLGVGIILIDIMASGLAIVSNTSALTPVGAIGAVAGDVISLVLLYMAREPEFLFTPRVPTAPAEPA